MATKTSSKGASEGTEVRVLTYTNNENAVVPDGWEIISVDHDRQMAVTRVTVSRPYDSARAEEERAAATGPTATPTYPQPTGSAAAPPVEPSTSYEWGTLDTTKVQNLEALKRVGPTIAEREAAGMQQEQKDSTEVASEIQTEANADSADPAHTPDKPVDTASEEEARAAAQSPASADVAAENAKSDSE